MIINFNFYPRSMEYKSVRIFRVNSIKERASMKYVCTLGEQITRNTPLGIMLDIRALFRSILVQSLQDRTL